MPLKPPSEANPSFEARLLAAEASVTSQAADILLRAPKAHLPFNVKDYGATGDGSTDDTAAFNTWLTAASGKRGYIPDGTYRVGDLAVPATGTVIDGQGAGAVLKAKTGASYVLKIEGIQECRLSNFTVDGNAKASHGILIRGTATDASQTHTLDRVTTQNCNRGIDVDTNTVDQADKNTYIGCAFKDSTIGMRIAANNAQDQVVINANFATLTTAGIDIVGGALSMIGGQFQVTVGANKGIRFSGANIAWVTLDGVIFEGPAIDIDGSTNWPHRMSARNCIFQGATNTILNSTSNSFLICEGCRYNNSRPRFNGTDQAFLDLHPFYSGITDSPDSSGATQFRYQRVDANGVDFQGANIKAQTMHDGFASLTAKRKTSSQQYVFRVDSESDVLLAAFGPKGELVLTEQTGLGVPAANTVFLHSQDNGAGKTQLIAKWPGGASTTVATEP